MADRPDGLHEITLSENGKIVLAQRYQKTNPLTGEKETVEDLFWRVAKCIAEVEKNYESSPWKAEELAETFYNLMADGLFLPNSPTLMNAGLALGQLAACFVLPIGDSIEEIFDAVKYAAMIHKSGGGTGFSFSRLRPQGSIVGTTGGVASGPVSFLRIFNTATEQIKQGGTRRGANMGILRVDHPDILEFISAKEREGEFNNFNLSVALTESFMEAAEKRQDYDLVDPHSKQVVRRLNAGEVFDLLVNKAWASGDPGIVFLDRINRDNPCPQQGEIEATNPCGEQPLQAYEACNLGSMNLANMVLPEQVRLEAAQAGKDPLESGIDWDRLRQTVHLGVRFLDNVIDASRYPLPIITETVHGNRKIGLGVMGFADMLFQLGIPYASKEGLAAAERVMGFVQAEGRKASMELAAERGPFPNFEQSVFPGRGEGPFRNATVTTIAPTGTLSIIAACSSGIEPLFALAFTRNVLDGRKLSEVNPHFLHALSLRGLCTDELVAKVQSQGTVKGLGLPHDLEQVFATAQDIAPYWHVAMQAAFQRHTDNAVSKTVNLPHEATVEDVRTCYLQAYREGCKGVTIYRDGCKNIQVLSAGSKKKEEPRLQAGEARAVEHAYAQVAASVAKDSEDVQKGWTGAASRVRSRPDIVHGFTQRVQTGLGTLYLTVNEMDGKPFEVFATIGKSGHSVTAKAEAIGRLVSLALRSGVDVRDIASQLRGIGGEHPVFRRKGLLLSIPDAVAWVLESHYLKGECEGGVVRDIVDSICPDCGGTLTREEGCMVCHACGFSHCG